MEIVGGSSKWRLEDLQSSRHAGSLLSHRIDLLSPESARLAEVGAMLGKEFDLQTATALTQIRSARSAGSDRFGTATAPGLDADRRGAVHVRPRQIRDTLLERLPPDDRIALHRRAARLLATQPAPNVFELAYHFDAANESEAALEFALVAAEQARAQHSLEIAAQQYRIAQRGAATSRPGDTLTESWRGWATSSCCAEVRRFSLNSSSRRPGWCRASSLGRIFTASWASWRSSAVTWRPRRGISRRACGCSAAMFRTDLDVRRATRLEALVQIAHTLVPALIGLSCGSADPGRAIELAALQPPGHGYWFVRARRRLWTHLRA